MTTLHYNDCDWSFLKLSDGWIHVNRARSTFTRHPAGLLLRSVSARWRWWWRARSSCSSWAGRVQWRTAPATRDVIRSHAGPWRRCCCWVCSNLSRTHAATVRHSPGSQWAVRPRSADYSLLVTDQLAPRVVSSPYPATDDWPRPGASFIHPARRPGQLQNLSSRVLTVTRNLTLTLYTAR